MQAEGLVRTLPHQDRSLQKLICDLPLLPPPVLHLLRAMIGLPHQGGNGAEGNETDSVPTGGERVTQALTAVWVVIKERPLMRIECLNMALEVRILPFRTPICFQFLGESDPSLTIVWP